MKIHRLTLVLTLISFVFLAVGNAVMPVTDPVESNYALTAKEMLLSGDWLSPQIYGQYWYDKPIMIYWLIAGAFKLFGMNDFTVRLPSAVFGALSVGLFYQLIRSFAGRRMFALYGACILETSLLFWPVAHGIITDVVLLFATIGTLGYGYYGLMRDKAAYIAVAYGFAAFGMLTKGPVALVLPGILLLIFAISMRSWSMVKRLFSWQGILTFIIIGAPWYLYMYSVHGKDFLDGFLGLNNVVRATQSEHPEDNVWWYYLAIFPLASLPWTGAVIYGMISGWKQKLPFYKFSMIAGWGTILFYSLMATKYPLYTYISLIPFSILGAVGVIKATRPGKSRKLWWVILGPALLLWIALTVGSFFVKWGFWYLLYVFVILSILLSLHFLRTKNRYVFPIIITVGTMLITSITIHEGLVPVMKNRSSVDLLPIVATYKEDVYFYNSYSTSLVYYTDVHAVKINAGVEKNRSAAWNGKYRMEQVSESEFKSLVDSGKPLLLVVPKGSMKYFVNTQFYNEYKPFYQSDRNWVYMINRDRKK